MERGEVRNLMCAQEQDYCVTQSQTNVIKALFFNYYSIAAMTSFPCPTLVPQRKGEETKVLILR